eukprot:TRINITY_DN2650_c0_g1_i13.p1 TRINITY_DN2650_c0_g1~~TRINITY_DN2650_c0_g1_i13.p1  ORF type:complete len:363 (-),score=80.23 TRINITY_DN2650_c0_g1_i13:626-1714(-)
MLMKRRPPLVAVLALSVTALLGRTLWVAGPKLIDTFGAIPLVPAAAVGSNGDGGRLGDGAVPFRQPRPGVGPTLPRRLVRPAARVWDAAPQAPTSQRTLRRLAQSSREPNPPEADLAYFVQVSASNVALLPRLMAAIYHPDNAYAVHFDVKIGAAVVADTVDKVGSALAAFAAEGAPSGRRQRDGTKAQRTQVALPENVLFMDRTPVTYRGITTVLNTLEGMSTLLNYTRPVADGSSRTAADAERPPWTYFINLSASDYPLLSTTATRRLLGRPRWRRARPTLLPSTRGRSGRRPPATATASWSSTRGLGCLAPPPPSHTRPRRRQPSSPLVCSTRCGPRTARLRRLSTLRRQRCWQKAARG